MGERKVQVVVTELLRFSIDMVIYTHIRIWTFVYNTRSVFLSSEN